MSEGCTSTATYRLIVWQASYVPEQQPLTSAVVWLQYSSLMPFFDEGAVCHGLFGVCSNCTILPVEPDVSLLLAA
jgi:hypothetical protein